MDNWLDRVNEVIESEKESAVRMASIDIVSNLNRSEKKEINGKTYILYDDAVNAVRNKMVEGGVINE